LSDKSGQNFRFNMNPTLSGPRLTLRPILKADRDGLYTAACDPEIWAQHPASDRHEISAFDPYFDFLMDAGGTLVAIERIKNRIIGCSRIYCVPDQPGDLAIGFTFLAQLYWGGSWNREMKQLLIAHILRCFPRVWFHIAPGNVRSQIATTRLGAKFAYDAELLLGPNAAPYKCYKLTAEDWKAATGHPLPL